MVRSFKPISLPCSVALIALAVLYCHALLDGLDLNAFKKDSLGNDEVSKLPEATKNKLDMKTVQRAGKKDTLFFKDTVVWGYCGKKRTNYHNGVIQAGASCIKKMQFSCFKHCQMKELGMIHKDKSEFDYDNVDKQIDKVLQDVDEDKRSQLKKMVRECAKEREPQINNNGNVCNANLTDGQPTDESKCQEMDKFFQCVTDGYYDTCKPGTDKINVEKASISPADQTNALELD